jgi:hypothetical protein
MGKNISGIEYSGTSSSGFPEGRNMLEEREGGEGTGASVTGIYSRQLTRQPRPGHTASTQLRGSCTDSFSTVVRTISREYQQEELRCQRRLVM